MLNMTNRFAHALLDYAEEYGLEEVYRQVLIYVSGDHNPEHTAEPLHSFLAIIPGSNEDVLSVMYAFLEIAQEQMNLLQCEIISAVPLTPEQLANLEAKLIRMFRKQLDITTKVDPSLLGGLRVIVDNTVLDDSIKRKLRDIKNSIYEGVYLRQ